MLCKGKDMRNPISKLIIVIFSCLISSALFAARPEAVLDNATSEMLDAMKTHSTQLKQDPNYIISIVDKILVPHVDTADMAKLVVGKNAWVNASPAERKEFTKEFKKLVIRTYASTFNSYNNQKIEYLPIKGNIDDKKRVQVQSLIREPGKETIRVSYRLVKAGNSWRVYDIIIEGVSILKGFQSQFASDIRAGGMAKAIDVIKAHNAKSL